MVHFQQLKLLLVLGTVFAAPTFIMAAEAENELVDKPLAASPLRQAARMTWFQHQCETTPDGQVPTPEEQQALMQAYQAMGMLMTTNQEPAKKYNFLAPYVGILQIHLAGTALGAETIINILEHPEQQATLAEFVQKFIQNPQSIAAYEQHVRELEQACGEHIDPEHAAALLFAIQTEDPAVSDQSHNYNNKGRYCLERLKQGTKFACSTGVPWAMSMLVPGAMQGCLGAYGVPGIACYFLSSKLLNHELLPYPLGSMIGIGSILKSRDYSLWKALPAGIALGAAHATAGAHGCFEQNKYFDIRAGLKNALKLAPYLYPFGLSNKIHVHAPCTIQNAQQAYASLITAGYMDVALHIAKLHLKGCAIRCTPAASTIDRLTSGLQQLWQATAPATDGTSTLFPAIKTQQEENTFAIEKNSSCKQNELFDLFILNAITAQTFKIALNISGCALTQLTLPALSDMQFFAIHHYRDNTENMVMHHMQVKI
ncbi:hypothetical protein FJ365_00420 [Candidatus Dependentiae bacterium]|nr:hypothetical protein [Candidatus Dependentiae bacterium]